MKNMKKIISLALVAAMSFSLVACSSSSESKPQAAGDAPAISILGYASVESNMNILADQLKKAGFDVTLNVQPEYSSFTTASATGNWDISMTGWTTVTGNPDYAVRDIFGSTGTYNRQYLNNPTVDELIDKAATETPAQYQATYTELENVLVTENAYLIPLYSSNRMQGVNTELMEPTMRQPKSRSGVWEEYTYIDESLNATRPLVMTQTSSTLTSLDPIQANDGSINQLSSNVNVRIMNLTDEDEVEAYGSLSRNFAIAEGNQEYYFILRDDVNFSKVEDGKAVDTGVRVGAEDVVFTLERAKDPNSVELHQTHKLHMHMESIEIVTDLEELETKLDSDTGAAIIETLSAGLDSEVTALTADKTQADNANGTYQVVKVTTPYAFPQVLNYLAHQSAGILSEEHVTEVGAIYGDSNTIKNVENHLWMSGPYTLTSYDDYGVSFEKNPGYMAGTAHEPRLQEIYIKFISDASSALSSFRAGEIDLLTITDTNQAVVLEGEEKYEVMSRTSNGVTYATFNLSEQSKFQDLDLRKAALYAVDQNAFIAVNNNLVSPAFSTISTLINTGNVHTYDLAKSAEHLAAYQAKTTAE